MSACNAAIKMQDTTERKRYESVKKALRELRANSIEHVKAVVELARANKTIKRTRDDAMEAARHLAWVKQAEAYREEFGTGESGWHAFYRSIGYSKGHVCDLLNFLEVSDSIPADVKAKLGDEHLSFRQARVIGRVPEEDRAEFVNAAADAGQTSPSKLEAFRQQAEAMPATTYKPAEAPRQRKAEQELASIQRMVTTIVNAMMARGFDQETVEGTPLGEIVELAQSVGV